MVSKATARTLRQRLLRWYDKHHRDLPWRRTRDPYKIWISEVMLQQTRVDTAIPYYERFIKAFPTVAVLAQAQSESVLKHWEGLGYYHRACNLQAAALELVEHYGGKLPTDAETLRTLKGFGPYTSAAVASIAFGQPVAAIDGNVRRVWSRVFATHDVSEALAQNLVSKSDPSAFNQAVMELGALVCLPRKPLCPHCPIRTICGAFQRGQVTDYPSKAKKSQPKRVYAHAFVLTHQGQVLIEKRQANGRWAGLWQFPTIETSQRISHHEAAKRFASRYGLALPSLQINGEFTHQLSHQTLSVRVLFCKIHDAVAMPATWQNITSISARPFSRLQQKVWKLAGVHLAQEPKRTSAQMELHSS